jgi:hypothetical protein
MFAVHLRIVALFLTSFVFLRLRINRQEHDGLARRKWCNLGDSRVPVSEPFCLAASKRDPINLEDAPRHAIGQEEERVAILMPARRAVLRTTGRQLYGVRSPIRGRKPNCACWLLPGLTNRSDNKRNVEAIRTALDVNRDETVDDHLGGQLDHGVFPTPLWTGGRTTIPPPLAGLTNEDSGAGYFGPTA